MNGHIRSLETLVPPHFYDTKDEMVAPGLQRLEVRAFGCLLDDVLKYVAPEDHDLTLTNTLSHLRDECLQPEVMKRPDFARIYSSITQLN